MIKRFLSRSLASKISASIAITSLGILLFLFAVLENINKEAFYSIELEKARIIAKTIEPLLALDLYLGMNQKIGATAAQLLENPNILAVKISNGDELIYDEKSRDTADNSSDSFTVTQAIMQPNSNHVLGELSLVYSSKHYKELLQRFTQLTITLLLGLAFFFILFSLYVQKLLSPLKSIARSLHNYTPESTIAIPYIKQKNEIGLIARALNAMQSRIANYAQSQKDINHYLEEKVNEKTAQLRRQLYTDALTGLPNRTRLIENIEIRGYQALLLINIDDFKEVNDFFGHKAGDSILIELSENLKSRLYADENIRLFKLSGDEFALVFSEPVGEAGLQGYILALLDAIGGMLFFYDGNEIGLRVTIGATLAMDSPLEKADIALKTARKHRKRFNIYDEKQNIEEQYKSNMEWVRKLKHAIESDQIVPVYQPIFDNATQRIAGYECLMRMVDETGHYITPYTFLEIAKKSLLYTDLTKIMIEKSCRHFADLNCRFSINLSVEDMLDDEIVAYIHEQVDKYEVAGKIIFEILESEGIENYAEIARFTNEMKRIGCKIAIDDFGSGYSNFEHLLQLKVDFIKIDGTLIKNIHHDHEAQVVVETIVDFARKLGIKTVAEFVHSDEVHEKVIGLNIDRSQGFFLGEPAPTPLLDANGHPKDCSHTSN